MSALSGLKKVICRSQNSAQMLSLMHIYIIVKSEIVTKYCGKSILNNPFYGVLSMSELK